jgi:hypothetical protein
MHTRARQPKLTIGPCNAIFEDHFTIACGGVESEDRKPSNSRDIPITFRQTSASHTRPIYKREQHNDSSFRGASFAHRHLRLYPSQRCKRYFSFKVSGVCLTLPTHETGFTLFNEESSGKIIRLGRFRLTKERPQK